MLIICFLKSLTLKLNIVALKQLLEPCLFYVPLLQNGVAMGTNSAKMVKILNFCFLSKIFSMARVAHLLMSILALGTLYHIKIEGKIFTLNRSYRNLELI